MSEEEIKRLEWYYIDEEELAKADFNEDECGEGEVLVVKLSDIKQAIQQTNKQWQKKVNELKKENKDIYIKEVIK